MKTLAADHSPAWQSLGVSLLHKLVLDHLIKQSDSVGAAGLHLRPSAGGSDGGRRQEGMPTRLPRPAGDD